jgi:hypothetical protein
MMSREGLTARLQREQTMDAPGLRTAAYAAVLALTLGSLAPLFASISLG